MNKNIFRDNKLLPVCLQKAHYTLNSRVKTYGINMKPLQTSFHRIIPSEKPVSKIVKY